MWLFSLWLILVLVMWLILVLHGGDKFIFLI